MRCDDYSGFSLPKGLNTKEDRHGHPADAFLRVQLALVTEYVRRTLSTQVACKLASIQKFDCCTTYLVYAPFAYMLIYVPADPHPRLYHSVALTARTSVSLSRRLDCSAST